MHVWGSQAPGDALEAGYDRATSSTQVGALPSPLAAHFLELSRQHLLGNGA